MKLIFLILALIIFLIAAFNVTLGISVSLIPLGLAFWVASQLPFKDPA